MALFQQNIELLLLFDIIKFRKSMCMSRLSHLLWKMINLLVYFRFNIVKVTSRNICRSMQKVLLSNFQCVKTVNFLFKYKMKTTDL